MYTIDDEKNKDYYEEDYEYSFWDNNKSLIIKIIIIILCIIVLIWLFKALNTSKNTGNENIYLANVEKVRLAAEDYFFIKDKKEDNKTVSVSTLKSEGLVSEIVDANNKVCSTTSSNATLLHEVDGYKMTVKVDCPNVIKEKVFYYHNNTLACLNCDGNTKMTGKRKDGGNKNDSTVVPVNNNEYSEYSCVNWSDWTKNRVSDKNLEERSKVVVRGVKYETTSKTVYGDWSEYTKTPIIVTDNLEVETIISQEDVWSNVKTARNVKSGNNIRIVDTKVVEENTNSCKNGFVENGVCYSGNITTGNLTYKEYNSGKYKVINNNCEGLKTLKNSEGKYVLTLVGCQYHEVINDSVSSNSYTVYEYQELEKQNVVYYRSRSINTVEEKSDPIYTKDKYEEKNLPEGYTKVDGSEEVYYSYKLRVCEK